MAVVYADVTREASTTTGTDSMSLDGVIIPGYQRFQDALIDGDEVDYEINDIAGGGVDREVGRGTWTAAGNTLSRDAVEFSTNADALVSWPEGIKQVRLTVKAAFFNEPGGLAIGDTITGATDTFVLHVGALGILAQSAGMRYGEANRGLHLTSQAIDEVPLSSESAVGQTANAFELNTFGVIGGDILSVDAAGNTVVSGALSTNGNSPSAGRDFTCFSGSATSAFGIISGSWKWFSDLVDFVLVRNYNLGWSGNATGSQDVGFLSDAVGTLAIIDASVTLLKVDPDATAGNTRLSIYDNDNAALERVTVGAADSGGAGFKLLRIPN